MQTYKVIKQSELTKLQGRFIDLKLHPLIDRDDRDTLLVSRQEIEKALEAYTPYFDSQPEIKEQGEKILEVLDQREADYILMDVTYRLGVWD